MAPAEYSARRPPAGPRALRRSLPALPGRPTSCRAGRGRAGGGPALLLLLLLLLPAAEACPSGHYKSFPDSSRVSGLACCSSCPGGWCDSVCSCQCRASVSPSQHPSTPPSGSPTTAPTTAPTWSPTADPSRSPTAAPSASPTRAPTGEPTSDPTGSPSRSPTAAPSGGPTTAPTSSPSGIPTGSPTLSPTAHACDDGSHGCHNISAGGICIKVGGSGWKCACDQAYWCSAGCSGAHTAHECTLITAGPSVSPSTAPTTSPSVSPTMHPTHSPTTSPTVSPSATPTASPTQNPSAPPSVSPSFSPTTVPSASPSASPTHSPSASPTTAPTTSPTTTPSVSPTQGPTAPPTGPPTRSPTTGPTAAPTLNPSISPTWSPTAAPSTTPTANPTTSPSWYPTAGPSTSPSAGPTPSPTWSPTTAAPTAHPSNSPSWSPTADPSTVPTRAPIAGPSWSPSSRPSPAPSAAPSAVPSSVPTTAPSTTLPSAAPLTTAPTGAPSTTGPSAGPSLPPAPRPSLPPSEAPSASPTPAPSLGKAAGVAQGAAEAGAASAVLAVSAPAAAQGGRVVILTSGCTMKEAADLPWSLHPTQLAIEGFTRPMHAGCVVANLCIVAAAAGLHFLATVVVQRAMRKRRSEARGMLRFPTVPVLVLAVLSQGSTFAGAGMIRHASAIMDVSMGIIALVVGAWLPVTVLHAGRRSQRRAVYKLDPGARSGCKRLWLGSGEWLSLPNEKKVNTFRVERWGIAFRAALPYKHGVLALDIALTQAVAFSAGLGGGSCQACGHMRIGDTVAALALAAVVLRQRPYSLPWRIPVTVAAQLLIATGAFILALGFLSSSCGGNDAVAAVFIDAGGLFTFIIVSLEATAALRGIQLSRRDLLTAALERFTAIDEDGIVSPEELRTGLRQVYGMEFAEDEFERLFSLFDEDGSGLVDLHDFLANEHLFWDAGRSGAPGALDGARADQSEASLSMQASVGVQASLAASGTGHFQRSTISPRSHRGGSPGRIGAHRPAFTFSGAGDAGVNGSYDEMPAAGRSGRFSPRRFKCRGSAAQVVRSRADGSWRVETHLPGGGLESSGRRSRRPGGFFGSARAAGARGGRGGLAVLYTHAGSKDDDGLPPREGWSTTALGTAPPPRVSVPGGDAELAGLDEHNATCSPPPGGPAHSPLWVSATARTDSPGMRRIRSGQAGLDRHSASGEVGGLRAEACRPESDPQSPPSASVRQVASTTRSSQQPSVSLDSAPDGQLDWAVLRAGPRGSAGSMDRHRSLSRSPRREGTTRVLKTCV
eukprot:TRINITY_DN6492_c0_g1_i2.p1 TRINITY_DN6492_c0_g1~~TRINITY_DN6492_c0_g1_i2.p1  ORF type:complete len:1281 (+),score=105.30 TRINITY_DN6492_c0_g1_i2:76-3918(+)